eukprot:772838-Prorocentrum_lima.AAC.1
MTSSLVGSEMCIRDRCSRMLALGHAAGGGETAASTAGHRCSLRLPKLPCCLLYTSDAADDM